MKCCFRQTHNVRFSWHGLLGERRSVFVDNVRSASTRTRSHYAVLGVTATADQKEIKDKFYDLSKRFHPDVTKEEDTVNRFKEITEAYDVLSNPELRKQYDANHGFNRVTK